MELTVQNVYGLLLRSKLLSVDEAKSMFTRWQQESKDDAGNVTNFMLWIVANKYLTEYQARLLARGHADGFFLNDYKILERLGKGRMAGVYKGQHELGQIVAIKVLPPSKAKEANMLGRFHREARLALRLKHPNIVRTFQTGVAEGLHFIVMEHLEGETLEEVLSRRGKMPPSEAVRLVYQALQGLQHIHVQGLVHRDLKPANMMLIGSTPDSTLHATLKILDIGLGRTLFDEKTEESVEAGLTTEGVLLGTPDYMAPEQARDARTTDIRADIYSLGCVLYHLLTGQPPFPDTNLINQMIRHATETPKPLKSFNLAVPEGLQQVLNAMMAKDPAQRYPTPEGAAQALQTFLASGTEQLAEPESDPHMRPYLNWLEKDSGEQHVIKKAPKGAVEPKPPSGNLPAAIKPPSGNLPGVKSSKPPKEVRTASDARAHPSKHSKKKHRSSQVAESLRDSERTRPKRVPDAAPESAEEIDVELVPAELAAIEANPVNRLHLSRREMIVFAIGALLGAVVTFVGALLAFKNRE
ncbi:MAG TPA: serine/threonine-protein kinase [Gemmataceae bacterium]|nr:serine/threonine-protein kinase [Gemmataceae bacterium]